MAPVQVCQQQYLREHGHPTGQADVQGPGPYHLPISSSSLDGAFKVRAQFDTFAADCACLSNAFAAYFQSPLGPLSLPSKLALLRPGAARRRPPTARPWLPRWPRAAGAGASATILPATMTSNLERGPALG